MAIFVDANARKLKAFSGWRLEICIQYTNKTGEPVSIRPNQAVFDLFDSADRLVQRHSPDGLPETVEVPPGDCFRFELNFTTNADLQGARHSLRSAVAGESAYSLIRTHSVARTVELVGC